MILQRRQINFTRRPDPPANKYNINRVINEGTTTWKVPSGVYWIDTFVVGGGGYGGGIDSGAGGGGYTRLVYNIEVTPGEELQINVGSGGTSSSTTGGTSYVARNANKLVSADGGKVGIASTSVSGRHGGAGGSGGGAGCHGTDGIGGAGGSDGGNGGASNKSSQGGSGQGTTTRCPWDNTLYGGGGGGMRWVGTSSNILPGGAGGGGNGGTGIGGISSTPGAPNTGGGGGNAGSNGGSGIVIIRY